MITKPYIGKFFKKAVYTATFIACGLAEISHCKTEDSKIWDQK